MKPSIKTLEAAFPGHGKAIRMIIDGGITSNVRVMAVRYPKTADWVKSCLNWPGQVEVNLRAISELIEAHGTEAIMGDNFRWPDLVYINMGDSYVTTLAFDHVRDRYLVTSVGDWIEAQERKGITYA
jgi:hypothetical protein